MYWNHISRLTGECLFVHTAAEHLQYLEHDKFFFWHIQIFFKQFLIHRHIGCPSAFLFKFKRFSRSSEGSNILL